MKIRLRSWHAVGVWQWNVAQDDVCGICRVDFDGTCPDCKRPGDDCPLIWGKCSHVFHMHCLLKWLETDGSGGQCPMDRRPFEIQTRVRPEPTSIDDILEGRVRTTPQDDAVAGMADTALEISHEGPVEEHFLPDAADNDLTTSTPVNIDRREGQAATPVTPTQEASPWQTPASL